MSTANQKSKIAQAKKLRKEAESIYESKNDRDSYSRVVRKANESIALNPNDLDAFNIRGLAYSQLSQHQAAIESFTEAMKLCFIRKFYDPTIFYNRGTSYLDLKHHNIDARRDLLCAIIFTASEDDIRGKAFEYLKKCGKLKINKIKNELFTLQEYFSPYIEILLPLKITQNTLQYFNFLAKFNKKPVQTIKPRVPRLVPSQLGVAETKQIATQTETKTDTATLCRIAKQSGSPIYTVSKLQLTDKYYADFYFTFASLLADHPRNQIANYLAAIRLYLVIGEIQNANECAKCVAPLLEKHNATQKNQAIICDCIPSVKSL